MLLFCYNNGMNTEAKTGELKAKAREKKKKARRGMSDFQWFAMQVLSAIQVQSI